MTAPVLSVIIVSFNTRDMTLRAIETLFEQTTETDFECIVLDNASSDGSADAIEEHFPQVKLIRSKENLGFARANNIAAQSIKSDWLLLLNPDTEVLDGAVDRLLAFAAKYPQYGIYGGRTVFADGRLNPGSAWGRITLWSVICSAVGLTAAFRGSSVFNLEGMGGWQRDSIREVDIVQGSFFLLKRSLWEELQGFSPRYFMYGEEADLCHRARARGFKAVICPEATIVHHAGASSATKAKKQILVSKGRAQLIRDHWPRWKVPLGLSAMWLGSLVRAIGYGVAAKVSSRRAASAGTAREVWKARRDWIGS